MKESPPFSIDLVDNAKKHKGFLLAVHSLGVSLQRPSVDSLRRYRDLWLPLVHQTESSTLLIPPPDIAWLWHCHRLAPAHYIQFCKSSFGKILEANPPFTLQIPSYSLPDNHFSNDARITQAKWVEMYPTAPFFVESLESSEEPGDKIGNFHLLDSTQRQAAFLWQVSGERFDDEEFLEDAVQNYHKFIQLKPKATKQRCVIVPTYQIDLMWHTHILASVASYENDCKAIMGMALHHDDSYTDRSQGGILDISFQGTRSLWKEAYGQEYSIPGGMYRGEPPEAFMKRTWNPREDLARFATNIKMIGKMGASSTDPSDICWASRTGTTSDGKPSFIEVKNSTRTKVRSEPRRENYVLGKVPGSTLVGFYHLETKEAHQIMESRLESRLKKLDNNIAMAQCCGSCFGLNKAKVGALQTQRKGVQGTLDIVKDRLKARGPSGKPEKSDNTKSAASDEYYTSTGAWLYPVGIWDDCGGACGGDVACAAGCGDGGGSACGAACGGGGCDGGGGDGGGGDGGGCGGCGGCGG